jgi:hypothetical protein
MNTFRTLRCLSFAQGKGKIFTGRTITSSTAICAEANQNPDQHRTQIAQRSRAWDQGSNGFLNPDPPHHSNKYGTTQDPIQSISFMLDSKPPDTRHHHTIPAFHYYKLVCKLHWALRTRYCGSCTLSACIYRAGVYPTLTVTTDSKSIRRCSLLTFIHSDPISIPDALHTVYLPLDVTIRSAH